MNQISQRKRALSGGEEHDAQKRCDITQGSQYGNVQAYDNSVVHLGDNIYVGPDRDQQELEKLLESLSFPRMHDRLENIHEAKHETYAWILDPSKAHPEASEEEKRIMLAYTNWLATEQKIFWIKGKPGSGKSALMKHLVQSYVETESSPQPSSPIILSYFFWLSGDEIQRSMTGCLRSLLHQLLVNDRSCVSTWYVLGLTKNQSWSQGRLLKMLFAAIAQCEYHALIFLDALDECEDQLACTDFIAQLQEIQNLKLIVSSRPEPLFEVELRGVAYLTMQHVNKYDILKIIQTDFLHHRTILRVMHHASRGESAELAELLLRKAEDVFIWLHFAVRNLIKNFVNHDEMALLIQRIKKMPNDIHQLYKDMLQRDSDNNSMYESDAAFYFALLLHRMSRNSWMSLTTYSFAIDDTLRERYLHPENYGDQIYLESDIDAARTAAKLRARTAGMLEVQEPTNRPLYELQDGKLSLRYRNQTKSTTNGYACGYVVGFIHRTVRDFLLDTSDGREIMSKNQKSNSEISRISIEVSLIQEFVLPYLNGLAPARNWWHDIRLNEFDDRAMDQIIPEIERLCQLHIESKMVLCSPRWSCHDIFYPFRRTNLCRFPLKANSTVDIVPFLIRSGQFQAALRICRTFEKRPGTDYFSRLLATFIHANPRIEAPLWPPGTIRDIKRDTGGQDALLQHLLNEGASIDDRFTNMHGDSISVLEDAVFMNVIRMDRHTIASLLATCGKDFATSISTFTCEVYHDMLNSAYSPFCQVLGNISNIDLLRISLEIGDLDFPHMEDSELVDSEFAVIRSPFRDAGSRSRAISRTDSKMLSDTIRREPGLFTLIDGILVAADPQFRDMQPGQPTVFDEIWQRSPALDSFASVMEYMGKSSSDIERCYHARLAEYNYELELYSSEPSPVNLEDWVLWFWGSARASDYTKQDDYITLRDGFANQGRLRSEWDTDQDEEPEPES